MSEEAARYEVHPVILGYKPPGGKPRYRYIWDSCAAWVNRQGEVRTLERGVDPGPGWQRLYPIEFRRKRPTA